MKLHELIAEWLTVRPNELRAVALSFVGAFSVMGFLVLARSMREAMYLNTFDARTLPYIETAFEVLSVPTAVVFGWLLARHAPEKVLLAVASVVAGGLVVIWAFLSSSPSVQYSEAAVVGFYLWTALGTLLLISGFWVLTCEHFAVAAAERVFGLVAAGGTAGAMVMGNALVWLSQTLDRGWQFAALIALVVLFAISRQLMPRLESGATPKDKSNALTEGLTLLWRSPYLRTMAFIVVVVAVATTLLDYQFKEAAQAQFQSRESLTSFFGAFYGWTGAIALLINFVFVSRFLTLAGITWALAAVPLMLLVGSVGLLAGPSLVLVTAVRGVDASLRRSLYAASMEVLFVPLQSLQRRKTLTLIDSVVGSLGGQLGALVIFLCVTVAGLSSRSLAAVVLAASIVLLYLSRRMGRLYSSMAA